MNCRFSFKPNYLLLAVLACMLSTSLVYAQAGLSELQTFSAIYPQLFVAPDKPSGTDTPKATVYDPTRQLLMQSYSRETNYYQLSNNLQTNLKPTLKPLHDIQTMLLQNGLTVSDYDSLMQVLADNPQVLNRFVGMLRQTQGDIALLQLKQRWPNFANDLPTEPQRVVFRNIIETLQDPQNFAVASKAVFQPMPSQGRTVRTAFRSRRIKFQPTSGDLLGVAQSD